MYNFSEKDAVAFLNNIYEVNQKDMANQDDNEELTHIKKGVYINSLAYKDAFKTDKCQSFSQL